MPHFCRLKVPARLIADLLKIEQPMLVHGSIPSAGDIILLVSGPDFPEAATVDAAPLAYLEIERTETKIVLPPPPPPRPEDKPHTDPMDIKPGAEDAPIPPERAPAAMSAQERPIGSLASCGPVMGLEEAERRAPTLSRARYAPDRPLPRYKSHKIVEAVAIKSIVRFEGGGGQIVPWDVEICLIPVSAEWLAKHQPSGAGYWVRHPDGYTSWGFP